MSKTNKWIAIAQACPDCGGEMAIKLFDTEPTWQEKQELENAIGGMHCINTIVRECEGDLLDGEILAIKPEY